MIIYLNWIGGWQRVLLGSLAVAAGAFGLVDVCRLQIRASRLLLLALTGHSCWVLALLFRSTAWVALGAGVRHWVVIGRRFNWYQ